MTTWSDQFNVTTYAPTSWQTTASSTTASLWTPNQEPAEPKKRTALEWLEERVSEMRRVGAMA